MVTAATNEPVDPRAGRWAGAWIDLLDDLDGARVLVVDAGPGQATVDLVGRGARATFVDEDHERMAARQPLLGDAAGTSTSYPTREALARGPFDLIAFDSVL